MTAASDDMKIAARHEAGHLVVAAVEGLRLRDDGIILAADAQGIACYCKEAKNDPERKSVAKATYAGYYAESRFCAALGLPGKPEDWQAWGDGDEAAKIINAMDDASLKNGTVSATMAELQAAAKAFVEQHWTAIEAVADALLAKPLEPLRQFKSGNGWTDQSEARHLTGAEVADVLNGIGIRVAVVANC